MPFPREVRDQILVDSARHCCVCHRYKGVKVEVHHIIQEADGGENTLDNAICLCFDCHSDAGHYNSHHPKGTKFQPSELRKHKEAWRKIVLENKIPFPNDIESNLHFQYFICMDSGIAWQIANMDLSFFPLENGVLLKNFIGDFQANIAELFFKWRERVIKRYTNKEEYFSMNPSAENKSKGGKILFTRKLLKNELELLENEDKALFEQYLTGELDYTDFVELEGTISQIPIPGAEIGPCGEVALQETLEISESLRIKRPYFLYLSITNRASETIALKASSFTKKGANEELQNLAPPVQIKSGISLIIPIGQFIEHILDDYTLIEGKPLKTSGTFSVSPRRDEKYFGPSYFPKMFRFEAKGNTFDLEPHEFDSNNLYYFDKGFWGGSCPHVFVLRNGTYEYVREVIAKGKNIETEDSITIEETCTQLLVYEIEHEITYFKYVSINGTEVHSNVTLKNGSFLVVKNLRKGDVVSFCGFYQPLSETTNNAEAIKFRDKLITSKLKNLNLSIQLAKEF